MQINELTWEEKRRGFNSLRPGFALHAASGRNDVH